MMQRLAKGATFRRLESKRVVIDHIEKSFDN